MHVYKQETPQKGYGAPKPSAGYGAPHKRADRPQGPVRPRRPAAAALVEPRATATQLKQVTADERSDDSWLPLNVPEGESVPAPAYTVSSPDLAADGSRSISVETVVGTPVAAASAATGEHVVAATVSVGDAAQKE